MKHKEPAVPAYVLREADIREMIKDGSIDKQHFLIRILAENIK